MKYKHEKKYQIHTSAAGPSNAKMIGKNSNPSKSPSRTRASSSLKNSRATKPNSLVASIEAANAAASAPCTTGANTDSSARETRRRLHPIDVTNACKRILLRWFALTQRNNIIYGLYTANNVININASHRLVPRLGDIRTDF